MTNRRGYTTVDHSYAWCLEFRGLREPKRGYLINNLEITHSRIWAEERNLSLSQRDRTGAHEGLEGPKAEFQQLPLYTWITT